MRDESSAKLFGISLIVFGLLFFIITLQALVQSYFSLIVLSHLEASTKTYEIFGELVAFACGKMIPLSLLVICAGAAAYPKAMSRLAYMFLLITSSLVVLLSGYYFATMDGYYCGDGSISICAVDVGPIILLIPLLGLAMSRITKAEKAA